ncbi:hypothetical protein [Amycolatopsis solani]|uniref:hypothetical protein n=1 Tax=Amycolatopsis solani TaxID=3028615 RepID=UPI0025AF8446|nr:hypothetical protein [Amycolatopsis sp. MEP2-6]
MTAVAAATIVGGVGFAGAADAAGPPVYSKYRVTGTTHIAKPVADLKLGPGQFDMYTQIGSYTFSGTITLPPAKVTKVVPGIGAVSGTVTLGPGHAEGSVFGGFTGSATWPVKVSDVRVNGVPYDVGASCGTAQPVTTELVPDGFTTGIGGRLTSTYAIGEFANCGSATPLLTGAVAGPGNTLALDLTAG